MVKETNFLWVGEEKDLWVVEETWSCDARRQQSGGKDI